MYGTYHSIVELNIHDHMVGARCALDHALAQRGTPIRKVKKNG